MSLVHPLEKLKAINDKIAWWFRGSCDRGGGRKTRNGDSKENGATESAAVSSGGADANSLEVSNQQ